MTINTPHHIWEKLCEKLQVSTEAEGDIEEIGISFEKGGIKANTTKPLPELDRELDDPIPDEEELPTNDEVFIYEDFGLSLKESIIEKYHSSFRNSQTLDSKFRRITVTESNTTALVDVHISLSPRQSSLLFDELADALAINGEIDNPDEFAYGRIDKVYENSDSSIVEDGWEFDGTIYKYTEEPYEWWSEPSNIEEWADFVSESDSERKQSLNRDKYIVHLHPMRTGLEDSNPYIRWFKNAEETLDNIVEKTSDNELYLSSVHLDSSTVSLHGTLKL